MKHVSLWLLILVGLVVAVSGVLPQRLDPELSYSQIIRSYCDFVKDQRFYRQYKLKENCMLNVQVYRKGKQVGFSSNILLCLQVCHKNKVTCVKCRKYS